MGIPAAPRGMPQIEVTFDIDANGIVNVSAKDLGTGTEQSIKIESQTSLSEEEIKQKIEDAEKFAEDDKLRKAKVETRNNADSIVYQTRKMIEDAGEKLSEEDTKPVLEKLDDLESMIIKNDEPIPLDEIDEAAIQTKLTELEQSMHAISTKLYEAAAAEMSEEKEDNTGDEVVDADFEVVEPEDED